LNLITIFAFTLQLAIFALPLFFEAITTDELVGMQFLGTVLVSWIAMFSSKIRIRDLLYAIASFAVVSGGILLALHLGIGSLNRYMRSSGRGILPLEMLAIIDSGFISGIALQLASAGIISAGLWMKANRAPYIIRRAGTNRQERDLLFDLRQLVVQDEMTNWKYVSLQNVCPGIVLEFRGDVIAFLRYVVLENFLVIFDLIILPEARVLPHSRELPELLLRLWKQPGLEKVRVFAALPLDEEDEIQQAVLRGGGFRKEPEPDSNLRAMFASFRLPEFTDWQPFTGKYQFWARQSDALPDKISDGM